MQGVVPIAWVIGPSWNRGGEGTGAVKVHARRDAVRMNEGAAVFDGRACQFEEVESALPAATGCVSFVLCNTASSREAPLERGGMRMAVCGGAVDTKREDRLRARTSLVLHLGFDMLRVQPARGDRRTRRELCPLPGPVSRLHRRCGIARGSPVSRVLHALVEYKADALGSRRDESNDVEAELSRPRKPGANHVVSTPTTVGGGHGFAINVRGGANSAGRTGEVRGPIDYLTDFENIDMADVAFICHGWGRAARDLGRDCAVQIYLNKLSPCSCENAASEACNAVRLCWYWLITCG